jgi:hypothetical protein
LRLDPERRRFRIRLDIGKDLPVTVIIRSPLSGSSEVSTS